MTGRKNPRSALRLYGWPRTHVAMVVAGTPVPRAASEYEYRGRSRGSFPPYRVVERPPLRAMECVKVQEMYALYAPYESLRGTRLSIPLTLHPSSPDSRRRNRRTLWVKTLHLCLRLPCCAFEMARERGP